MNFVKKESDVPRWPFRPVLGDMQQGNGTPQAITNNDMRNRRFIPPLIQTRSSTMTSNQMCSEQNWTSAPPIRPRTQQSLNFPMPRSGLIVEQSPTTHAAVYRSNTSASHNQSHVGDDVYHSVETGRRIRQSFGGPDVNIQESISVPVAKKSHSSVINSEGGVVVNAATKLSGENAQSNNLNVKMFGNNDSDKIFIFTGTVERVIKWNKIFRNHFCYFEVVASIVSLQEGSVKTQQIMLLRDKKGPILQVVYYTTTHLDIEDFEIGQVLRCVGTMSAPNMLNAVSIRTATQEEIVTLQRLCLICDQAVSHFLNV